MAEQRPFDTRRAGVLLHVTSLPPATGGASAGDLGEQACGFVDFLADAGCSVWQVLPLVPTHDEDGSPYNAVSAMAGNPRLVSRDRQAADGLASPGGLDAARRAAFEGWCRDHAAWLDPYVQFTALRELSGGRPWTTWEPGLRDRRPAAVAKALSPVAKRVEELRFEQWVFDGQWARLRRYAADRGVLLFGDLPIFVSHDSADVWAARELFLLDDRGRPVTVTGCPPDYFAADGQRWNNPHYDWEAMAADGFAWWRRRIARQRELFDLVRIDHFRGFEAAWHVPVEAAAAREGRWVAAPGADVLAALVAAAGPGTLVAEDLGVITPEVEALRDRFGLPGMKILQFAFDGTPDNPYLPSQHGERSVVYTGTHDNDTTAGWWAGLDTAARRLVRASLVDPDEPMPWALVRLALRSTAALAVVPAQDLLGLGSECRMNTPGTDDGNWQWQARRGAFDAGLAARLRSLVEAAGRSAPPATSRKGE
ncbi:MAG TPA: 4-alpha-glucanotransferase [Marmoricola sp.]|nr:4-alpha-glucanotransferase [Marmoricola sp.]